MDEYIKREAAVKIGEKYGLANGSVLGRHTGLADCIASEIATIPAADVAPIEALERLRDEMCAQDLITMEGLRRLNTLIWKYTTVHDGGQCE
nr:MAG TPA: hypothetical protein [Caudoviricetes sp.]